MKHATNILTICFLAVLLSGCNLLQSLGSNTNNNSTATKSSETQNIENNKNTSPVDIVDINDLEKLEDAKNESENKKENEETQKNTDTTTETNFTINLASFSFTPNKITMNAGQTIKVKLINTNGLHDFVIDELGVTSKKMNTNEEAIIEITAPTSSAGKTYKFYCSVGQHRAMGMVGTLEIK